MQLISALPETWLVHLIRMADEDPGVTLVRLAKEEEAIGISAGAHLAGVAPRLLMQNHGFLAAINGIVSLAQLYRIPLLMLIAMVAAWRADPWHTRGRHVTEGVLGALEHPIRAAGDPTEVGRHIRAGPRRFPDSRCRRWRCSSHAT